ncbi:MAG: hypothetical protein MR842_04655 [Clostridiales bacterium]|nr:hypothetical protein [Clostridiales bacterium]MDO4350970.1 hypothetical protein [Eubacteriales bacterium]MDY4008893.1 hypothetical protein [Candidatus Limiplasma sp.]
MERTPNRFFSAIPRWLSAAMGGVFALLLALLVAGQPALQTYYQNRSLLSNAALWPLALLAIALLMLLRARMEGGVTPKEASRRGRWMLRAFFAALLAVQLVIVRCCWYKMGWDIANVYGMAEELARGQALSDPAYFSLCPNNAPLTVLQAVPLWFAVKLGLSVPFVVLPYLDAVLLNLTAYLCLLCVRRLTPSRLARGFALAVATGWIALSPYLLYPYTDTFSILFPVLALYAYLCCRRPALKWFLVSLACFFGASVKPTALIFLIALVLLGLCRFLARRDFCRARVKGAAIVAVALLLGAVPGRAWQSLSTAYLAGSPTPQEQLSETHYLMLGMNGATYGGHSPEDVAFSTSFPTLESRHAANLQKAWERLSERSLAQNLHFFAVKAYKAYADGSFAANSSFLDLEIPKRTDALSGFLRAFYHHRGGYNPLCHTLAQALWLGLLTLCAYTAIARRSHPAVPLLSLTLMGVTAYLLLFEVWPRYLFLYAPFYVILAAMAFDRPLKALQKR